jgi:D-aminoacyl-tRNA deacylase
MRVLVQRVSRASVSIDGAIVGQIGNGFVLLVGVTHADGPDESNLLARKVVNLRILPDDRGIMNRSALDLIAGDESVGMLVVSQFTLYAETRKGRRPSFVGAAQPDLAEPLVAHFAEQLRTHGVRVETGRFGAMMNVELINTGPVTIWLDSDEFMAS